MSDNPHTLNDMQVKALALLSIFIEITIARRCPERPICYGPNLPPLVEYGYDRPMCFERLMTSMLDCGCDRPMCYDICDGPILPAMMLDCGCDRSICNDGLILPPMQDCGCVRSCYDGPVLPTMLGYGSNRPMCYDVPMRSMCCDGANIPPMDCGCGCVRPRCNKELVLPPIRNELPRGLGYFPSAVPLVTSYFSPAIEVTGVCAGASVPVTSPCSCLTLAAPVSPDIALLVRSVVL